MRKHKHELAGQQFGRWVVLNEATQRGRNRLWVCQCECGESRVVCQKTLLAGESRSCGCAWRHFQIHGLYKTKEYSAWAGIKTRCLNPRDTGYSGYGGRGIGMCERWRHSFESFLADMGNAPSPQHSIGRIDNDGDYEPSNCRWETPSQQQRNTRRSAWIEYNGERKTKIEWAQVYGIPYKTFLSRLRSGWSVESALIIPVGTSKSKPPLRRLSAIGARP